MQRAYGKEKGKWSLPGGLVDAVVIQSVVGTLPTGRPEKKRASSSKSPTGCSLAIRVPSKYSSVNGWAAGFVSNARNAWMSAGV